MLLNPYRFGLPPSATLTGLISYWQLDEAAGDAVDVYGTNALTDTNTVAATAGKIGGARSFVRANSEYFVKTVSGDSLSMGASPFTWSCWAKLNSSSGESTLISKNIDFANSEFQLYHDAGNNRIRAFCRFSGGSGTLNADTFGAVPTGVWLHVCFWHDLTVFGLSVNGIANTMTSPNGNLEYKPAMPFWIGAKNSGVGYFDGQVDEVGLWKRALSPAERADLYNFGDGWAYPFAPLPPSAAFSGTPLTGTFPLSVTFTDTSARSPTSWAWAKNNGSGWVPFAGTPTAQNPVEVFAAGMWSVRLTATNSLGSDDEVKTKYVVPQLFTNLISYWKLDEASGDALDAHGTNHLTDVNTVGTAAGKVGSARDFEANSVEYFTIPNNASLQLGDIQFTFTVWVKFESFPASSKILAKDDGTGLNREFLLQYGSNRIQAVLFPGAGVTVLTANSFGALTAGVWYFIAFWYDPAADKMYLQVNNGAIDEAASAAGTNSTSQPFLIGAYNYAPDRNSFDGLIDEVGFWKRILTPTERTALYNAGNGLAYPFT